MAGYSGTPLPRKLGIKEGARVGLVRAPADFRETLGELPDGVVPRPIGHDQDSRRAKHVYDVQGYDVQTYDVIVCFARSPGELAPELRGLKQRLDPAGGLWIAWPKKSQKKSLRKTPPRSTPAVASDLQEVLDEGKVRSLGLAIGLVDNKVCAIDDVWSGLRFVVRLADRPSSKKPAGR